MNDKGRRARLAFRDVFAVRVGMGVDAVDAHVRHVMQEALDGLAKERRLPVIG